MTESSLIANGWGGVESNPLFLSLSLASHQQALALMPYLQAREQAQMLAFSMLFGTLGAVMAIGIPMVLMMRRSTLSR